MAVLIPKRETYQFVDKSTFFENPKLHRESPLMSEETPVPTPTPEPGPAPSYSPPIYHEEVPKPSSRKLIIGIVLIVVVLGAVGFAVVYTQTTLLRPSAASPRPATGYNTYSNWGFSFQYPNRMTISERGLFDNTADGTSGIVTASTSASQTDLVLVAWSHSVNRIDPSTSLSGAVNGFQSSSGGTSPSIGQQGTTTTMAGYAVAYEPFSITISGTRVNGVWSAWYSSRGQRLYQLGVVTSGQNALNLYNTYLSSFVEL